MKNVEVPATTALAPQHTCCACGLVRGTSMAPKSLVSCWEDFALYGSGDAHVHFYGLLWVIGLEAHMRYY